MVFAQDVADMAGDKELEVSASRGVVHYPAGGYVGPSLTSDDVVSPCDTDFRFCSIACRMVFRQTNLVAILCGAFHRQCHGLRSQCNSAP